MSARKLYQAMLDAGLLADDFEDQYFDELNAVDRLAFERVAVELGMVTEDDDE